LYRVAQRRSMHLGIERTQAQKIDSQQQQHTTA
jgi:hypothetical protein